MAITVKISGQVVRAIIDSAQADNTIDQSSTANVVVHDPTGTAHYQPGQPITIDDDTGRVFTGFINGVQEQNLYPKPDIVSTIDAVSQNSIPVRKKYKGRDFSGRYAGDIGAELALTNLTSDGIVVKAAIDHDAQLTDFQAGTFSNAVATTINGNQPALSLAPAGTSINDSWTPGNLWATFNGQTASGTTALQGGDGFTPNAFSAIAYSAVCTQPSNIDAYLYTKIWSGSYAVQPNDNFVFDIWISKNNPAIKASCTFTCSDGTTLRGSANMIDGLGNQFSGNVDLAGLADNKWYNRSVNLDINGTGPFHGKTITSITLDFDNDTAGTYIAYYRRVKIANQGTGITFSILGDLDTALPMQPQIVSNASYASMSCTLVTAYESSATVVAYIDMTGVQIYQSSLFSWIADTPTNTNVTVTISPDGDRGLQYGATYLQMENGATIPGLIPGQYTGNLTTFVRFLLTNSGADPTIAPKLRSWSAQINSSYKSTKTDIQYRAHSQTDWQATGASLTNVGVSGTGALALQGSQRDYITNTSVVQQPLWGINGNVTQAIKNGAYQLNIGSGAAGDGRARLDWAGSSWQNFTIDVDIQVQASTMQTGVVYRTTAWSNTNDTYAYTVNLTPTLIQFGHGTNSTASGAFTQIATSTIAITAGTWHHLRIVVNGTSHKVWLDDTLYINATDATFTGAGSVALRCFTSNTSGGTAYFRNFGIMSSLTGQWVSPAKSLATLSPEPILDSFIRISTSGADQAVCSTLVELSLDNGSTWTTVTPGTTLPGLSKGVNTSTYTATKVRLTLTAPLASNVYEVDGLSYFVLSAFSSTGSRVSPALNYGSVGQIGSASATWVGSAPTGTTTLVETSPDSATWSTVGTGGSGAGAIPGIVGQGAPIIDNFTSNTSANYSGGGATWTFDTAHSRLIGTGSTSTKANYRLVSPTFLYGFVMADMDYGDAGGLMLARIPDGADTDFYYIIVNDASATSAPGANLLVLYKRLAGVTTELGRATISFTRGDQHRFMLEYTSAQVLNAYMDGALLVTWNDSTHSPLTTPNSTCGFFLNGPQSQFYSFYVQPYGTLAAANATAYSRVTFTTTDPTVAPTVTDLSLSVRGPSIMDGALIEATSYGIANGNNVTLGADFDDLASKSDGVWFIDNTSLFNLRARTANPGPFPLADKDILFSSGYTCDNTQDAYRNSQWITGAINQTTRTESFNLNGSTTTFPTLLPIDSIVSLTMTIRGGGFGGGGGVSLPNFVATLPIPFGTGSSTGVFLYTQGASGISQGTYNSGVPLGSISGSTATLTLTYVARVPVTINVRNESEIAARAALDGTSGVIEESEAVPQDNTTKVGALALAKTRLTAFTRKGRTLTFTTKRIGHKPGQLATVTLTPHGIIRDQLLIQSVSTTWREEVQNGVSVQQRYDTITAVEGPVLGDWTRFLVQLGK